MCKFKLLSRSNTFLFSIPTWVCYISHSMVTRGLSICTFRIGCRPEGWALSGEEVVSRRGTQCRGADRARVPGPGVPHCVLRGEERPQEGPSVAPRSRLRLIRLSPSRVAFIPLVQGPPQDAKKILRKSKVVVETLFLSASAQVANVLIRPFFRIPKKPYLTSYVAAKFEPVIFLRANKVCRLVTADCTPYILFQKSIVFFPLACRFHCFLILFFFRS